MEETQFVDVRVRTIAMMAGRTASGGISGQVVDLTLVVNVPAEVADLAIGTERSAAEDLLGRYVQDRVSLSWEDVPFLDGMDREYYLTVDGATACTFRMLPEAAVMTADERPELAQLDGVFAIEDDQVLVRIESVEAVE